MTKNGKDKSTGAYQVGYSKPPQHTQFKPGESGNPHGRPKGTLNFASVLLRTLREKVVINENGQRTAVTKLEAAVKQLVNRAATGDLPALRQLFGLLQIAEESAAQGLTPNQVVDELDGKVMLGMLKRYEQTYKRGTDVKKKK